MGDFAIVSIVGVLKMYKTHKIMKIQIETNNIGTIKF